MPRAKQSMDGNTAAAHVAYAYTDVAAINFSLKSTTQRKLYSSITVKNLSEKIQSQFPDTKKVPAQNTLYTQYVL